ncbi:cytochrome oxidase small assembly protein [Variovorax sp. LT1P1]
MTTPEQKKANRRMGLTLASIAVLFFIGFFVRMVWIGV